MEKAIRESTKKNDDVDMISMLPNDVVAYILSNFLSTEDAVRTSILAKRWRNVWAFVSVLDFKFHFKNGHIRREDEEKHICKFVRFVTGVVLNMETSHHVHRFRISFDHLLTSNQTPQTLCNLILHAIKYFKPRMCDITLESIEGLDFDTDLIFNCASLHHLVLSLRVLQRSTTISPNSINMPYLKSLELQRVTIAEDFIKKLLNSLFCPVLEKLVFICCQLQFIEISSSALKELHLEHCSLDVGEHMQIFTPNLVHFTGYITGLSFQKMPFLVCAYISFIMCNSFTHYEYIASDLRLLDCLSNATTLCLTLGTRELIEVWSNDFPYCKTFNNLESLTLTGCYFGDDFKLVCFFLQKSPKLRALNLSYYSNPCIDELDLEDPSQGEVDVWIRRVYLGTVEIMMWENQETLVDSMMQELLCHVKSMGDIKVLSCD